MKKYPTLYWTPCVSHCLHIMIEYIEKIKNFNSCIAKAKKNKQIYSYLHVNIPDLLRTLNVNTDILWPWATRFGTSFLFFLPTCELTCKHSNLYLLAQNHIQTNYRSPKKGRQLKQLWYTFHFCSWWSIAWELHNHFNSEDCWWR
jgi:hypothetical protein